MRIVRRGHALEGQELAVLGRTRRRAMSVCITGCLAVASSSTPTSTASSAPRPISMPATRPPIRRWRATRSSCWTRRPSRSRPTMLEDVRRTTLLLLPSGRCTIEQVAEHLGVACRTVQRGLAEQGQSFSSMVNEIRKELATRHVIESDRPLTEVAMLLGFSAPSAFSRWYHAQFGCSAKESRAARVAGAARVSAARLDDLARSCARGDPCRSSGGQALGVAWRLSSRPGLDKAGWPCHEQPSARRAMSSSRWRKARRCTPRYRSILKLFHPVRHSHHSHFNLETHHHELP